MKRLLRGCVWLVLTALICEQVAWAAGESVLVSLPSEAAVEQRRSIGRSDELVINIQDAHSKLGAQQSIAQVLDQLVKNYDLKLIALEGASGGVDTSLLSRFPEESIRRQVGEKFLGEGRISAGEFYSITSGASAHLYGAEDGDLYRRNLSVFRRLVEKAPQVREEIRVLRRSLSQLEEKVYSPELVEARKLHLPKGDGQASFEDYWRFAKEALDRYRIDLEAYPYLKELDGLFRLEERISFKAAESERSALLTELSRLLPADELGQLFRDSLDHKRGRLAAGEYHRKLLMVAAHAKSRTAVPELTLYQEYLGRYDTLDLAGVLDDARRLEGDVISRAAKTADERILVRLRAVFEASARSLTTSLTGGEYALIEREPERMDLERALEEFGHLASRYGVEAPEASRTAMMRSTIGTARLFYQLASARDQALLNNTLRKMRRDGVKIAALVSGGFHSEGLMRSAEGEGVSCLIVMPRFDANTPDRPYVTVLTKKPKEFEEVFKGSDEILAVRPLFAADGEDVDHRAVVAELFAAVYVTLDRDQYFSTGKAYLRDLMRTRSVDAATARDIAWLLSRSARAKAEDPAIRRESGAVALRFPDGKKILVSVPRPVVRSVPRSPAVIEGSMRAYGARLAQGPVVDQTPSPQVPEPPAKDKWGWKIAALAVFASVLGVVYPTAAIAVFGCGVFSQLGPPAPADDDSGKDPKAISKRQRAVSSGMALHTKQRGSQALGGASLLRFPMKIWERLKVEGPATEEITDRPEEISALSRPEDREGFVGIKLLNERLFDIVKRFDRFWEKAEARLRRKGFERASVESEIDHSRLATGGGNSVPATHPHQHLDTRRAWVWRTIDGAYRRVLTLWQVMIVHNGDFNGAFIFNASRSNDEIRAWLERVLNKPYGASWWEPIRDTASTLGDFIRLLRRVFPKEARSVGTAPAKSYSSDIEGDSPGIAGMMDLLITQGSWFASLRAAYQFAVAATMKDRAPSDAELKDIAAIVESVFVKHRQSGLFTDPAAQDVFARQAAEQLIRAGFLKEAGPETAIRFVSTALSLFIHHDGHEGLKSFMRMTIGVESSTYGLEVATSMDPSRKHYASYKQPFYVGYDPSTGSYRGGSDLDAVRDSLTDENALMLRLDQEHGEVMTVGVGLGPTEAKLYSISQDRELSQDEIRARWVPKSSPYLSVQRLEASNDRVRRDLEAIAALSKANHDRWTQEGVHFDPTDHSTYHLGTADHLVELLIEQIDRFEDLQSRIRTAGIQEAVSPTAPDIVIIGIENSLIVGRWWADLLQTIFPILRDRVRVIPANEFVLDPGNFVMGPNTIVWNISRSGQTFPSFHSTVETSRLKDQGPEALERSGQVSGTENILQATQDYLQKLEDQRAVREVFILTRDLGSEMAAAIGQSFQPEAPFERTILTDGGKKSDTEPASQSVVMAYQTLVEMTLYAAKRLREHYPNGSRPLGLVFREGDLATLGSVVSAAVTRTIPLTLGVDADGTPLPNETVKRLDRQGDVWGRSIQESGWYTLVMKAYVFLSVLFKASLFGYWIFPWLAPSLLPAADVPGWAVAAGGASAFLDAVLYTWGTELFTYLDRAWTGRTVLARHGTRTVKIFARRTHGVLDVFFGKMFAEAPTYFSVFRRHADPANDALQHEAFDATAGTMVLVTVPDGRLSRDLGKEADSTRMAAVQTKASGNRFETTPEVVLITTNPNLAALKRSKKFQNVLIIPSETHEILKAEGALSSLEVADRMGDVAYLVGDTLSLLTANYRLLWAASERASKFRVMGQEWRIWDNGKTQDQANVHTTAAPNAPSEAEVSATYQGMDWVTRALPLLGVTLRPEQTVVEPPVIERAPVPAVDAAKRHAGGPFWRPLKRVVAGTLAAVLLASTFMYLKPAPVVGPGLPSSAPTLSMPALPEPGSTIERTETPAVVAPAPAIPSAPAQMSREENLRRMTINYRRAATEKDPEVAGYYFRAAERRASRELKEGSERSAMIEGLSEKAARHMDGLEVTAKPVSAPVLIEEAPVSAPALTPDLPRPIPTLAVPLPVESPKTPEPSETPAPIIQPSVETPQTLWKPTSGRAIFYTDVTGARSLPPLSFSTFEIWAKSSWVKLGVTFEGNYTGTTGTIVPKFNTEVSLSPSGNFRLGVRKTVGNGTEALSTGVMTTFMPASGVTFAPEAWVSVAGPRTDPAHRSVLVAAPIVAGPVSVTPAVFAGQRTGADWQLTGSFDQGANHLFASKNFTSPLITAATFMTPDTGKFRLGYARDIGSTGLRVGVYGFKDPALQHGFGIIVSHSAPLMKQPAASPNQVTGPPPPPPPVVIAPTAPSIQVGILLTPGVTADEAQERLAAALGDMTDRIRVVYLEDARSLLAQGSPIVLSADAISDGDTKLALLKTLAQLDRDSLDLLLPFTEKMLQGDSSALTEDRMRDLLAVIGRTFPKPAPRKIILTSRGAELAPELIRSDNGDASVARASAGLARMIDEVLTRALQARTEDERDAGRRDLRETAQVLGRFLSDPEPGRSARLFEAKVRELIKNLPTFSGARLSAVDPGYRRDLTILAAPGSEPKTVITDLEVFLKDGEGLAFARRMDHLDRRSKGLIRHVLLVRDVRFRTREDLVRAYPHTARFGPNVLFAFGLSSLEELARYRGRLPIERSVAVLTPESAGMSASLPEISGIDRALVVALDERAENTIGILEEAVLQLVSQTAAFRRVVYLPPLTPMDYGRWLEYERLRRSAQRSA